MKWAILCVSIFLISAAAWFWWPTQGNRNLRGSYTPSTDHQTYLVIADDNGGGCDPILIDGAPWNYKKGEVGLIASGAHQIQCGKGDSGIGFEIPAGTVFRFDYWGP